MPVDPLWTVTHFCLGAAQGFGAQNPEAAAAVYEAVLPYRSLHACSSGFIYWGPMELPLGVLARALANTDAAVAHHEAAAMTIETCRAARARALNNYQWAVALLARDGPGDRQRAADMAQENLAYCRTKRYTTFVIKTEELLATI